MLRFESLIAFLNNTTALYQIALQFDGVRKALPCSAKGFFESLKHMKKDRQQKLPVFFGSGIRIRTSTYGVRDSQSFFKTAYLSHFSDLVSLKNLYQLCIRSFCQIRMMNCEPYNEVYQ